MISAFEYLGTVRSIERKIRRLTLQRDELQACLLPAAIVYDKDVVQTSPEDKLSEIAAAVVDLDREIEALRQEKAHLIRTTSAAIDQLEDETEKLVLTEYFIARMTIRQISDDIHYSVGRTYGYYRAGLQNLDEKLNTMNKQK